jgi:GMP synthase-like glutamine amidotransferase
LCYDSGPMKTSPSVPKIALVDNSIEPEIYRPVEHWGAFLPPGWSAFRAPAGVLPSLKEGFTHVVLTGSEASILEPEPWVEREVDFVREAERRGLALLGSCYGHQLLALALAGPESVGACREPEIGWIPVVSRADSGIFGPRGGKKHAFSLHFDEVRRLSDRFLVLAGTDICPVQAFVMKDRPVWGYQIHPEINPEQGRALLRAQAERNGRGGGLLYGRALDRPSLDSGLIGPIVSAFLWAFSQSAHENNGS